MTRLEKNEIMTEQKKGKRIVYLFAFLVFLFGIGLTAYHRYLDSLPQDYTIGKIYRIWQPANGDIAVNFSYYYYQEYTESEKIGKYRGKLKDGERYLVKFPEGHPERGIILFEYPVPDSIVAPEEGWDELPAFAR